MCRERINPQAVCSSKNYTVSKRLHHMYLKDTHDDRMKVINNMKVTITNPTVRHSHQQAYIVVYGNRLNLRQEDIPHAVRAGFKVYYK